MSDAVLRRESAVEFFKELVDDALARQHVSAGELTAFYVVHLLASFVRRPDAGAAAGFADDAQPMATAARAGARSGGLRNAPSLRQIGDRSLFMSGIFFAIR